MHRRSYLLLVPLVLVATTLFPRVPASPGQDSSSFVFYRVVQARAAGTEPFSTLVQRQAVPMTSGFAATAIATSWASGSTAQCLLLERVRESQSVLRAKLRVQELLPGHMVDDPEGWATLLRAPLDLADGTPKTLHSRIGDREFRVLLLFIRAQPDGFDPLTLLDQSDEAILVEWTAR